ncbi:rna polymerase ii degradation factor 1-like [Limosa lapponica baueri]|uniref:Rna polymerase ii degradation factor 1-like n=1 Tax=Limosa lapponica baueri TaxID=1758121 RepID=A0A2I0SYV3_LIMLA|nr:rna polymerase ii degradation factor 1-like [Limosa lapponica baueri]
MLGLGAPSPAQHPLFSLSAGTPSAGEPRQQADGPTVSGDLDNPAAGVPGLTPHPNAPSGPPQRTPEYLRHRQLPVLPGDAGTATADPAPDAEGPIYESILKKPWDAGSALGDAPSLPAGDEPSVSVQEIMAQEEPDSEGSPSPIYAQVCKMPRAPQPRQPHGPPEPQEETPPSLPEKHFDVA